MDQSLIRENERLPRLFLFEWSCEWVSQDFDVFGVVRRVLGILHSATLAHITESFSRVSVAMTAFKAFVPHVSFMRCENEMPGIYAAGSIATMGDFHASRDFAVVIQRPDQAMGTLNLATELLVAIAIVIGRMGPGPANVLLEFFKIGGTSDPIKKPGFFLFLGAL
jgi:hypothetical protein